ncbi:MAG: globin domain-containing protein [Acidimicrobiales bacterium]
MVDVERLKRSWDHVAAHGDQVALRFYSRLFVAAPQIRDMFPLSMVAQRDRLVTALGVTVSHVDDMDRLVPYLQQLGRDHRRFGVGAEHYAPVAEALFSTLADFLGPDWTADLAQDWADAFGLVARIMHEAATQAADDEPAWWEAEVVAHERRTFDIAVLTLQPQGALAYRPGQSMALETALRPRLWRYYSPANAPRDDGSIDLHVRRIPGGQVSGVLVDRVDKGDLVRLGGPVGRRLTLPSHSGRDLVMVAGGTGLAPLKAVLEEVVGRADAGASPPTTRLFLGARTTRELYDLDAVRALAIDHAWLAVTAVVPEDPLLVDRGWFAGVDGTEEGDVAEVASRHVARRRDHQHDDDVYVCGSDRMVQATWQRLREVGCPAERIHHEGFQGLGGESNGVLDPGGTQQP